MPWKLCAQCGKTHLVRGANRRFCDDCLKARLKVGHTKRVERKLAGLPAPNLNTLVPYGFQSAAHRYVQVAMQHGVLPRLDGTIRCVDCGDVAYVYDHRDYSRPLVVAPVCQGCNLRRGSAGPVTAEIEQPKAKAA